MPNIKFFKERCKGCERCRDACPQQIIKMAKVLNKKGYFYADCPDSSKCIGCRTCAITCPDLVIRVNANNTRYTFFDY